METTFIGIDVSKMKLDVCILLTNKTMHRTLSNNVKGFEELVELLRKLGVERVHACMESTGRYWEGIANHLHHVGHMVSVVPPARIKGYGRGEFKRTKTDKADAGMIGRFCEKHRPAAWTPPQPQEQVLKDLERQLLALKSMAVQEQNRLESGVTTLAVRRIIEAHLEFLKAQRKELEAIIREHINNHPNLAEQNKLIVSIKGIGGTTAAIFLGEVGSISKFRKVRQLDAFAGLDVSEFESGSSIRGKPHISRAGSNQLRTALYYPALSAMRSNPIIKRFVLRLKERRGKLPNKVVICAVMRKLLHLIYGVLKSGCAFDPNYGSA